MAMKKYVKSNPSVDTRESSKKTADAVNKAKVKRTAGTADSKTRRSTAGVEKYGVAARNKGTSPDYQYHVTGSSTKKVNSGKRISEKRTDSGFAQYHYGDGSSEWGSSGRKFNTSDAIVKPRVVKKAAAKKTATPRPKKR
jgi:hypothetical protein